MNPTGDPAERGPLSGLVVADFSRILAGPYATMMLADLGADVIKVESPAGDDTRTWKPPTRDDQSTYYLAINRNKRSIALDLTDPDDLAVAHRLAARADVMVQNFRHGGLDRFGLDHDTVRAANPGLVYASITGFGSGEGAALPGYDLMVQAISGLMSLTGDADGPPMRAGVAVCDVITGLHAAVGILAALQRRADRGSATTSRSTCSARPSPVWSTRPARSWPVGSCPPAWATPTPASSPTTRCPPPTATSS